MGPVWVLRSVLSLENSVFPAGNGEQSMARGVGGLARGVSRVSAQYVGGCLKMSFCFGKSVTEKQLLDHFCFCSITVVLSISGSKAPNMMWEIFLLLLVDEKQLSTEWELNNQQQ